MVYLLLESKTSDNDTFSIPKHLTNRTGKININKLKLNLRPGRPLIARELS